MERPTILPYRWPGHALDVRAHLSTGVALFNAADVCEALRIGLEQADIQEYVDRVLLTNTFYPLPTTRVPGTVEDDGSPSEYFTADQVRELAQDAPEPPRDEFLAWFAESFGDLAGERLEQALDAALPEEPGRRQPLNVDVATAARILSRDPALEYGRDSLFAAMHSKRWIRRDTGIWVPSRIALRAGYLMRDRVRVPGQKDWYPQIRITNVGLLQLHFLLGGTNDLVLDEHTTPTLVGLP